MSNTEGQHGSPGQEHPGQKPVSPGNPRSDRPQPGKEKGTPPRTPDRDPGSSPRQDR